MDERRFGDKIKGEAARLGRFPFFVHETPKEAGAMLIRRSRGWEIKESAVTSETAYLNRRALLAGMGLTGMGVLTGLAGAGRASAQTAPAQTASPGAARYPAPRNPAYDAGRALTAEAEATTYNNFYEFGMSKNVWRQAQALPLRPWTISIEGLVEQPQTVDFDKLAAALPLEERIYRFRCVEAWAMTVPWTGFPLKALVEYARPLSSAKYLEMQTFSNPVVAPAQKQTWYPWPYTEGLTMAEATNDLAFIATGIYGKPLPPQNGAPLRLATPWKYGFKSVKSIVRFRFTDKRPVGYWEKLQDREYGFWANVNPQVSHPRWSQAHERLLGGDERVPTQLYNGYAEQVAHLYQGMTGEKLFM